MQPQAPPRRKSSTGAFFIVLVLVGVFFLGGLLLVAAGAFVFVRTDAQQAHAIDQHEMARRQVERMRVETEMQHNHAKIQDAIRNATVVEQQLQRSMPELQPLAEVPRVKREKEPIRVANREITLLLDEQGKIALDEKPVEQQQLAELLRNAVKGRESALSVTLKVNKKCLFEHVAAVLAVCQELDIPDVRITAAE